MLLPSSEPYNSWRASRSTRWPSTSLPKLRASCSPERTAWLPTSNNAAVSSTCKSGEAPVTASNAWPVKIGIAAASAALPVAPARISSTISQLRRMCETTQRSGPRVSVLQG